MRVEGQASPFGERLDNAEEVHGKIFNHLFYFTRQRMIIKMVNLNLLDKLSSYVYKVGRGCCAALFVVMLLSAVLQVFCRYVLNYPLLWPEELTRFSMVWLTFIGASLGVKKGSHVSFTLIVGRFSGRLQRYFGFFGTICLFVFASVNIGLGIRVLAITTAKSPALNISLFWPKLGMIIGLSFILIHTIYFAFAYLSILFEETQS